MIDSPELPTSGFTDQRGPAITAEDFSAKPIGFIGFAGRRRAFISGNTRLNAFKGFRINQRLISVDKPIFAMDEFADVLTILQDFVDGAVR